MIFRKWLVGMLCMGLSVFAAQAASVPVPVNGVPRQQAAYSVTLKNVSGDVVVHNVFIVSDRSPAVSEVKETTAYVKEVCVTGGAKTCPGGKEVQTAGKTVVLVPGQVENGIAFSLVWKGNEEVQFQMTVNQLMGMKNVRSVAGVEVQSPKVETIKFDKTLALTQGQSKSFAVSQQLRLSVVRLASN